jgi:hypothetical protein
MSRTAAGVDTLIPRDESGSRASTTAGKANDPVVSADHRSAPPAATCAAGTPQRRQPQRRHACVETMIAHGPSGTWVRRTRPANSVSRNAFQARKLPDGAFSQDRAGANQASRTAAFTGTGAPAAGPQGTDLGVPGASRLALSDTPITSLFP